MKFEPVSRACAETLRRYYEHCDYGLCEYSVGTKLMWKKVLHPAWTEAAGCLVIRNEIDGQVMFDYPVPGPEGDEEQALEAIERYCMEQDLPLVVSVVPEQKAAGLLARYPYALVGNVRTWRDYLYETGHLQTFAGRRYSGVRNHLNKFRANWPQAFFRPLTAEDREAVEGFWTAYEAEFAGRKSDKAEQELERAKKLMRMVDLPWMKAGAVFDGEKIVALSLGEQCGSQLIIHVEKALYSYSGSYQMMVQSFARHFGAGIPWINREDDAAEPGLRTSKLQYGPARLAPKYSFEARNVLLERVEALPELKTERLTLTALREEDIPAYNALVLDRERNRWWGYDDVAGLGGPVEERSFFQVAQRDFAARTAANFAIRLDGQFIGEAILYHFDFRGGAEVGCRIAGAWSGRGYGREAARAVADWGLYGVHLDRVVAKCFLENEPSRRMLTSFMKQTGRDETFFYFEKTV